MSDYIHYYYLHENGELIHKRDLPGIEADFADSDLVRAWWRIDIRNRFHAWSLLIEALAAGASPERVRELAAKWDCTDEDASHFERRAGVEMNLDGNNWCATRDDFDDLMNSPVGFGETRLAAMAELCEALGYKAGKPSASSFGLLVKCPDRARLVAGVYSPA